MMGLHTKFGSSACVKLLPDSRRIAQNTHSLPLPSSAPFLVPFISFPCLTFPISSPFLLSRPLVLSPCSLPPFPCPPLPVVYRGLRISSTSGIRGAAPAANEFLTILTPGNTFGDNIHTYMYLVILDKYINMICTINNAYCLSVHAKYFAG